MEHVKFTAMKDGDKEDYDFLHVHETDYASKTANRLLTALGALDESLSGYQVTRLEHSLQTATRVWRDGADTDWVVAALLHDIGDIFAPYNHDEYAAAILKPFVREQCTWVVEKHGDFQLLYFGAHVGADPMKREKHKGHLYFDDCASFCERWDQSSFDPAYPNMSLDEFRAMVHEVFARAPYDPAVLRPGYRAPLHDEYTAQTRATPK